MISPDILKRSAVAGVLSVAVVGGAAALAPDWSGTEDLEESTEWRKGTEVSLESRTRMPQPVLRKAPPPGGGDRAANPEPDTETTAHIRARNRAAQRAMERLQEVYETNGRGAPTPQFDQLRTRIDRALERAEERSSVLIIER